MSECITVTDNLLRDSGMAKTRAQAEPAFHLYCKLWRDKHPGEPEPLFVYVSKEIWDDDDYVAPAGKLNDFDPDGRFRAPSEPLEPQVDALPFARSEGLSSPETVNAPDLRSDAHDIYTRSALPMSAEEVDASRAAAKHRQSMVQTTASMLGLRLPERGNVFGEVRRIALALGCSDVVLLPTGEVKITGPFGIGVYVSLDAAAAALNARCFHPGALG
jgi:hypothetical protein